MSTYEARLRALREQLRSERLDGFVVPPEGLEDIAALPNLTVALSRRGVAPRVLEKILGGNVLRVLDAVPPWGTMGSVGGMGAAGA